MVKVKGELHRTLKQMQMFREESGAEDEDVLRKLDGMTQIMTCLSASLLLLRGQDALSNSEKRRMGTALHSVLSEMETHMWNTVVQVRTSQIGSPVLRLTMNCSAVYNLKTDTITVKVSGVVPPKKQRKTK